MMDYKKFATQIETEVSKAKAQRDALEDKIREAKSEAAATEERCTQTAQGDDVNSYLAAKTAATQAAEKVDFYSMKLDGLNPYVYTLEQLYTAREEISEDYRKEQEELEKAMRDDLKALKDKLLPLAQKFEEHRKAGNAALRTMASATDQTDNNNNGTHANIIGIGGYYNPDNDVEKLLKVIEAILNNQRYVTIKF